MRKFKDIETGCIISEEALAQEFDDLRTDDPNEYDYSFEQYIRNCTAKNGFLKEIENLCVCRNCLSAIESREGRLYYNVLQVDDDDLIICDWCGDETYNEMYELV